MTSNIFTTNASPLEVILVRPKASETGPTSAAFLFIGFPLFALLLWAAFLGVGNDLFNVELSYWQCLLLMLGWKALNITNALNLWTRKNPADKK
ncbi:hypothetical protein J2X12_002910 [Pseudarthrobacter oxydans]|uniref:Uncharacterized protein n=1 Tax=Pseudarthrobacter oxydans TaxID=1671 RepID=A0AAW8NB78_PSEOX|nr:hypothetical protein [Pseudarthrobacter oxydans]MDR6794353.1 hypothetical protein [Pseudarthrobacter oxydans]MDR7164872.1 hypothetical protein [Pseudarthrobacter oxydans]